MFTITTSRFAACLPVFALLANESLLYAQSHDPSPRGCAGVWAPGGGVPGPNSGVNTILRLPNGDYLAGGVFQNARAFGGGGTALGVARYNPHSSTWTALPDDTAGSVYSIAMLPDGDAILGGSFAFGGVPNFRIARYNPVTHTLSEFASGIESARVNHLLVLPALPPPYPAGDVIACLNGAADPAGVYALGIARYSPATNTWSRLGQGVDGEVKAAALLPNGDFVVGGAFTEADNQPARFLARYSPLTNTWSSIQGEPNGIVNDIAVLPTGQWVVGGEFDAAGSTVAGGVAMYDPATSTWSAFGNGLTYGSNYAIAYTFEVLTNGDAVVGGVFDHAGGLPARNIARLNPTTGQWSSITGPGSDADGYVHDILPLAGNSILVGIGDGGIQTGDFRVHLARFYFSPSSPADFNQDGFINSADFFDFLTAFFTSAPAADFNHDTFINSQDFFDFLAAFFAGC